jgi:hypothetical protein
MLRQFGLALLMGSLASAADTTAAAPAPLDAATLARAEAAAQEYLKTHPYAPAVAQTPEQIAADHAFDQIDADLKEAEIYLDEKEPSKAGDLFLAASNGLTGLSATTRHFANDHYRASLHDLSQLAQRLLQEQTAAAATAPAAQTIPAPAAASPGPGPSLPASDGTSTK